MDRQFGPCRECDAAVPADATTCPACGYAVETHDRRRLTLGAAGTALTLSVALAPVGIPLLWLAHRHRLAAAGTVTAPADHPSLVDHLVAVCRRSLSLESSRDRPRGVSRGGDATGDGHEIPHGHH